MQGNPVTAMRVRLGEKTLVLSGRKAWALNELLQVGSVGLTTLSNPAPRWSHYVWLLRGDGFVIESEPETHGGPFAGHHARYRLASPVEVIGVTRQQDRRAAA